MRNIHSLIEINSHNGQAQKCHHLLARRLPSGEFTSSSGETYVAFLPRTMACLFALAYSSNDKRRLSRLSNFACNSDASSRIFCKFASSFFLSFSLLLMYSYTTIPPDTKKMKDSLNKSAPCDNAACSSIGEICRTVYPEDHMVIRVPIACCVCPNHVRNCRPTGRLTKLCCTRFDKGLDIVFINNPSSLAILIFYIHSMDKMNEGRKRKLLTKI